MLCSEVQLVKRGDGFEDIKPLPCRRWSCDHCAKQRRLELFAAVASGEPTAMLTLTISPKTGTSPEHRRKLLGHAWAKLCKRIHRQFQLPSERRWQLKHRPRTKRQQWVLDAIDRRTVRCTVNRVSFFAFVERTKQGEPHLHILLRMPFIPQDWIAEQMGELVGSPICDIRKVANARMAIFYVTKYVTKEPARFAGFKRYWRSQDWEQRSGAAGERSRPAFAPDFVRRERWSETRLELARTGRPWRLLGEGVVRVYEHRAMPEHWGFYGSHLYNTS